MGTWTCQSVPAAKRLASFPLCDYVPRWACWLILVTYSSFCTVLMVLIGFTCPICGTVFVYVTIPVRLKHCCSARPRVFLSKPTLRVPRSGKGRARETENLFRLPVIILPAERDDTLWPGVGP